MMAFEINEDPNFVASLTSQTGAPKTVPGNQRPLTKLMLSNIQIDGVSGLCRVLESALTGKPLPQSSIAVEPDVHSKKRVITEITDFKRADLGSNPRKVLKMSALDSRTNPQQH
jgi:hypothetical protein